MVSILLVDDERIVIDGISSVIRKQLPEIEIVATALSGREAVEAALLRKPDIILIDVRMPGMSGIDALRELARLRVESLPILLTAYERFDIAQEAFGLGVFSYLVKPMNQERLVSTLREAMLRVIERGRDQLDVYAYRDKIEAYKPLLEEALFFSLIHSRLEERELNKRCADLGFDASHGALLAIGFRSQAERPDIEELRATLSYRNRAVLGSPISGALPVFLPLLGDQDLALFLHGLKRILLELRPSSLRFCVCAPIALSEFNRVWPRLLGALASPGQGELALIGDSPDQAPISAEDSSRRHSEKECILAARNGEWEGARAHFFAYLARLRLCPALSFESSRALILSGYAALYAASSLRFMDPTDSHAHCIGSASSWEELAQAAQVALSDLGQGGQRISGRPAHAQLSLAIDYVCAHYHEQISLETLAEMIDLSPSYLSRLLAEATGKSFMEYLIAVRMDQAKRELSAGNKTIKEIAISCGYADPNYFSRLFKKEIGLTPSEYLQRGGKNQ